VDTALGVLVSEHGAALSADSLSEDSLNLSCPMVVAISNYNHDRRVQPLVTAQTEARDGTMKSFGIGRRDY
jgi:hypothetical protein